MVKLTWGQTTVLIVTSLPMAAAGVAGGIASYFNFAQTLASKSNALSLVLAGEGATVICALVALAVTLMGQHTPAPARAGLWLIPMAASAAGIAVAPDTNTAVVMGLSPLAMTASGEGITLVARRIVAFRTGVDIEQQRRSGLLVWHANRVANGGWLASRRSKAAVWRLTRQFASTDGVMAASLLDIQRGRIGQGADANLAAALSGKTVEAAETPSEPLPGLPAAETPKALPEAVTAAPEPLPELPAPPVVTPAPAETPDSNWDFIEQVLEESQRNAEVAPKMVTAEEAATILSVKPGTIRTWVSRGKMSIAEKDAHGRSLFYLDEVEQMQRKIG